MVSKLGQKITGIQNGTVFTDSLRFEDCDIVLQENKISDVISKETFSKKGLSYTKESACTIHPEAQKESPANTTNSVLDATDCYVIPGLTDIHFHGCVGFDFCDGTEQAIQKIAEYELEQGITQICPATMTLAEDTLLSICSVASTFARKQTGGANLCGIHLEGPFLSHEKKGAQNPTYLRKPDATLLHKLQAASEGLIRLVSIAPELEGAIDCIRTLHKEFVFSLAHTTADYETAMEAFFAGANHVTHLYNAMPPFSHRAPGVIGAAADTPSCDVELICDGVHIAAPVVRSTFRLFGKDRIILISDSMMATGMPDGQYSLGGQAVTVQGNLATLADGTIAGSATNLMDCVRMTVSMGIPLEHAIQAATLNPAKAIGMDDCYGSITSGKHANLVLLHKKDLSIQAIIQNGILCQKNRPSKS